MKVTPTNLFRASQNGDVIDISPDVITPEDLTEHHRRDLSLTLKIDQVVLDVPIVPSDIQMWDGGDKLYPHLHFTCPKCGGISNVDLEIETPNPRFACCDYCHWDSVLWVAWSCSDLKAARELSRC